MPVYTSVTANGKPAVLLNITRQPSSNTVAVADARRAEVAQLRKKLPPGVQLEPFYDQSSWCARASPACATRSSSAWCWPASSCFSFCATGRSSLVAGLVIPVTVAVTILFLWIIGQSFNLMTLGGLAAAIGLVIDDAIVVVENIVAASRRRRDARRGRAQGLHEITTPLVFSTITPVVVFLPLISVTGVTGSFFRALAVTMTVALLTSLLLALTWTPALSSVPCCSACVLTTDEASDARITTEPGRVLGTRAALARARARAGHWRGR